jgi:hypothetical protein
MIIDNIDMKYMIRIMIFIASLDITALQRLIIKLNSWNSGPPIITFHYCARVDQHFTISSRDSGFSLSPHQERGCGTRRRFE